MDIKGHQITLMTFDELTPAKTATDYFYEGRKANKEGLDSFSNPYLFIAWPFKCWELGWQFQELEKESQQSPYCEPEYQRAVKQPFQQGLTAFAKKITISDCPYGPDTVDGLKWQQGWIAAQDETKPVEPKAYNLGYIFIGACILWAILLVTIFV